jgi:ribosomal protein S18 acetylase RimI-like enzyme
MAIHLRPITVDDHPGLLALWRETWTETYGPSLVQAALEKMLDEIAQNGTASFFPGTGERGYCITDGQNILASAIVAERGTVAYLWGMYVHPNCQRQGLGSILLKGAVSQIATSTDIEVRVLPTSPWAVSFYQKLGFVEIGIEDLVVPAATLQSLVMSAKVEALKALPVGR